LDINSKIIFLKNLKNYKLNMNTQILIANILSLLAFVIHTFVGDRELKLIIPAGSDEKFQKREKWTQARCGWHMVSFDLLITSIGLAIINFTDLLKSEKQILQIIAIYYFGYGIVWVFSLLISKRFPNNFLKLGQWMLLILTGTLIIWGTYSIK